MKQLFVIFEVSTARDVGDREKALSLISYLDGAASHFSYEVFVSDGSLTDAARYFKNVQDAFVDYLAEWRSQWFSSVKLFPLNSTVMIY